MAATESPPPAPEALTRAFTYYAYDVATVAMRCSLLSSVARGQHHALSDDAWLDPRGQCRVHGSRLTIRCRKEKLDAKAICQELIDSKLWERDGDDLIALWLLPERQRCEKKYAQAVAAANRGAALRKQQSGTKPRTSRGKAKKHKDLSDRSPVAAPSVRENVGITTIAQTLEKMAARNTLPDNNLSDRSADAELIEVLRTSSYEEVLSTAAAPTASASHADGAAAVRASHPNPTTTATAPREVPDWRSVMCETQIADTAVPAGWVSADLAALVHTLEAPDTGVDVQRALYRLCAKHQRQPGDDGHLPLLDEIRAILDGAGGRDGLIEREAAAVAVALALHGANAVPNRVAPLLLRSIATATLRELQRAPAGAEPRRIAAGIASEFTKGIRKTSGYTLPCDQPAAPDRLKGHRVHVRAAA